MSEHMSPIPSRLYNAAVGGHVAGADQIIDDETGLTLDKVAGGALEEKEYTSGSNNGMGRVVLRKNLVEGVNTLVQTMINKSNTIYVIQYDFTLGENITIPANCVLEFAGGLINGSYTLTGNNTNINSNLIKIFDTNIIFNGTWSIEQWECNWFGAIADGVLHLNNQHQCTFSGTDNFDAIQCALYHAFNTNVDTVHISYGNYRISKPLYVGFGAYYNSIKLIGSGRTYVNEGSIQQISGTALLCDNDMGGIFINSSRGITVADLGLYGYNDWYHNYNTATVNKTEESFYYTTPAEHNGVAYAAIHIDDLLNNEDFTPYETKYGMGVTVNFASSNTFITNVGICGFYSGIDIQNCKASLIGDAAFNKIVNCNISDCVYGVRNFAYQNRLLTFDYCIFFNLHTVITNHNAKLTGYAGNLDGKFNTCHFDEIYRLFLTNAWNLNFDNCDGELIYSLGHSLRSSGIKQHLLTNCHFIFNQDKNNPNIGIIPLFTDNQQTSLAIILNNTMLNAYGNNDGLFLDCAHIIGTNVSSNDLDNPVFIIDIVDYCIVDIPGAQPNPTFSDNIVTVLLPWSHELLSVGDIVRRGATHDIFEVLSYDIGTTMTLKPLTNLLNGAYTDPTVTSTGAWYKVPKIPVTGRIKTGYSRPGSSLITVGYQFFDLNLRKQIVWNGKEWIDGAGTPV